VAENVKANAATLPVLSQLQGSFGAVFGFLVVLVIGLVMMFKVPTIADVLAVSASGAARDIAGAGFALDVLGAGAAVATAGKVGVKAGATGVKVAGTGAGFSAGALSGSRIGVWAGAKFGSGAGKAGNLAGRAGDSVSSKFGGNGKYLVGGARNTGKAVNVFSSAVVKGVGNATGARSGYRAGQAVGSTLRNPVSGATAREQAVRTYRKLRRASELRQSGIAKAASATGAALKEASRGPGPVKDPPPGKGPTPVKRPNTKETPPNE